MPAKQDKQISTDGLVATGDVTAKYHTDPDNETTGGFRFGKGGLLHNTNVGGNLSTTFQTGEDTKNDSRHRGKGF
jgi:hypothetical protein